MKIIIIGVIVVLTFGVGYYFLAGKNSPATHSTVKGEAVIGALYPFSGSSATAGDDAKSGIELALDIINSEYPDLDLPFADTEGLPNHGNVPVTVVMADHEGKPELGADQVETLVADGAVALMGAYNSAVTAAASEKAEQLQKPFLNPESTSPDLTRRGFKWFFRSTPDDDIFSKNFFTFLSEIEARGVSVPKDIGLLYENGLFGTGVARAEKKYAVLNGYSVVNDLPYNAADSTYQSVLQELANGQPSLLFQTSYERDAISLFEQYANYDIAPTAIIGMNAGFISSGFVTAVGEQAENVLSREVFSLDIGDKKPIVTKINDLYRERYGRDMNGNSARAFTGVFIMADALNRSDSFAAEDIHGALMDTALTANDIVMPWTGVSFNEENQNELGSGIIVQLQNGKYRTVWPFDLASQDVVWPMQGGE